MTKVEEAESKKVSDITGKSKGKVNKAIEIWKKTPNGFLYLAAGLGIWAAIRDVGNTEEECIDKCKKGKREWINIHDEDEYKNNCPGPFKKENTPPSTKCITYCENTEEGGICSQNERDKAAIRKILGDLEDNPIMDLFKEILDRIKNHLWILLAIFVILFCIPVLFMMLTSFLKSKTEQVTTNLMGKTGIVGEFSRKSKEHLQSMKGGGFNKINPKIIILIIFFIFIIYNE